MQAIDELNIKTRSWCDLMTGEKFKRMDIIVIQDPLNISGKLLENFHHIKHGLTAPSKEESGEKSSLRNLSADTKRVMQALGTLEAADAAAMGGGGRAAQAERTLAKATAASSKGRQEYDEEPEVRDGTAPHFKPGTATWNTDAVVPKKDSAPRSAQAAPINARKVVQVSRTQTTGYAAVSFTSTSFDPVTVNEHAVEIIERAPTSCFPSPFFSFV